MQHCNKFHGGLVWNYLEFTIATDRSLMREAIGCVAGFWISLHLDPEFISFI